MFTHTVKDISMTTYYFRKTKSNRRDGDLLRKYLIVIFAILILSGCSDNETLPAPTNLQNNDLLLTWDEVEKSDYYTVQIGENDFTVFTNEMSLHDLNEGLYEIIVYAKTDDGMKAQSEPLSVDISNDYEYPANLRISDDDLLWDSTQGENYEIQINDDTLELSDDPFYALDNLEEGTYTFRVKSIYENGESVFSDPITHHVYSTAKEMYSLSYSMDSEKDIALILPDDADHIVITEESDTQLSDQYFSSISRQLFIKHEYLSQINNGEHILEILTSEGLYELTLQVTEKDISHLLTNRNIVYKTGEDIKVNAESFGKGIASLSGGTNDELDESEYTIDNEMVTIDSAYFDRLIEANTQRETVIMSVALNDGEQDTLITYVFIDITNP